MKPSHIRVFDGLRMTTQHMEHLQGGFNSAVEDLREILGLGEIHCGFEVAKNSEKSITVNPGIAFDLNKNRIVCEGPQTLEVIFDAAVEKKFVCLKYEQVEDEDGIVEGQPTLIWDSGSILIRDMPPETRENLLIAAILVRHEEEGTFEVMSPQPKISRVEEEAQASSDETSAEVTEITDAATEDFSRELEEVQASGPAGLLSERQGNDFVSPIKIAQGIVRLEGGEEGYLPTSLAETLKQRQSEETGISEDKRLHFVLAEKEVPLEFKPSGLTTETIINATLEFGDKIKTADKTLSGESELKLRAQTTARGEATFSDDVSQFGVTSQRISIDLQSDRWILGEEELSERGLAQLTLTDLVRHPGVDISEELKQALEHLEVLVTVEQSSTTRFTLLCQLVWKGSVSARVSEVIAKQQLHLFWRSVIAWKAIGYVNTHHHDV